MFFFALFSAGDVAGAAAVLARTFFTVFATDNDAKEVMALASASAIYLLGFTIAGR